MCPKLWVFTPCQGHQLPQPPRYTLFFHLPGWTADPTTQWLASLNSHLLNLPALMLVQAAAAFSLLSWLLYIQLCPEVRPQSLPGHTCLSSLHLLPFARLKRTQQPAPPSLLGPAWGRRSRLHPLPLCYRTHEREAGSVTIYTTYSHERSEESQQWRWKATGKRTSGI